MADNETPATQYAAYAGAEPYFALVRDALGERVEGPHFFDVVADDVVYEVRYELGWPRQILGRAALMSQFSGYVQAVRLTGADHLFTHVADNGRVVVIEYDVHGVILGSGASYSNRFCSVVELQDRKIRRWRDYMDSLAASQALRS